jgi:sterol desaturase/sphingolipid hydroxylase (fatty acid hydroxylase superfamily)
LDHLLPVASVAEKERVMAVTFSFFPPNDTADDWQVSWQPSNRLVFFTLSWFIIIVFFYLHSWFFVLADWGWLPILGNPLERYAIRSGKNRFAAMKLQEQAILEGTLDTFLIKPLMLYYLFPYLESFIQFDMKFLSLSLLELFSQYLFEWLVMNLIYSTSLYFIHRLLHLSPFLYKNFHKKHHLFTSTISFASLYAHPVEALASSFHFILSLVLVRPHLISYLFFLITVTIEFVDSHCGYDVPWSFLYPWSRYYPWGSGARMHDFHHSHNVGCYGGGLIGLWDQLFQTNKEFKIFEKRRLTAAAERKRND